MSQFLSQIPRQLLQQQQRLTPQLIQAMDILQLPMLALEERIAQEIDGNPALELAPGEDEAAADEEEAPAAVVEERPEGEETLVVTDGDARDFARLDNIIDDYGLLDDEAEYRGTKSRARLAEEGDLKLDAMANTSARPISLQEHLLQQWGLLELSDETRPIGARIIDYLEETGRLGASLEEIAAEIQPTPTRAAMEQALKHVQGLDPAGIGARSLQECLLLQVARLPGDNRLEYRIISEHLEDLQKNRLPQIAHALHVDIEEVKAAINVIGRLSLHPGIDVVDRHAPTIVPDVIVEYDENARDYVPRLARGNARELRISPEFRELLEKSRDDRQTREFVKAKLDAAAAIIDAVRFRRERLLDVAKAVVEAQRDFLERGEQHLRVLRMSDLAERFGCDPSTISRTVDEKYIQTPHGVFPLRKFFTGGAETGDGDALGWDSIRAKVHEIVQHEDKKHPLSDDEIVEKLQAAGIDIKRRTVAKYRAQLDIPNARQRRQF